MAQPSPFSCPSCEQKGRKVGHLTPTSLLTADAASRLQADEALRFCRTQDCDIVYFGVGVDGDGGGSVFTTSELTVPVFQKGTDPERLVCYCFEHSVASISDEIARTGASSVPDSIGAQCKAGLDDCERKNPQGSCCLGNVRGVVNAAIIAAGGTAEATDEAEESDSCCVTTSSPRAHKDTTAAASDAPHSCCATSTPNS